MRSTAKILLALVASTGLAGVLGAGVLIGSHYTKIEVARQEPSSATEALLPPQDESEPEPINAPPDYEDSPGFGGGENLDLSQAPVSNENRGWTHIPWLVDKPREVVEKSYGDPQNTNENVTTPVWSYWKGKEELRIGYNAIVTDELLGQGRTFSHPMVVAGVSYIPCDAEVKVKEIIPLELAGKPPHYRVLFHEKRQYNPTNRFIVTWVNDGVMIVIESYTASSATSEERYYNRERGLHEWRYRINEEVICSWAENQVESYRQESIGVRQDDPRYGEPNEITGHVYIGKGGDWEVYF